MVFFREPPPEIMIAKVMLTAYLEKKGTHMESKRNSFGSETGTGIGSTIFIYCPVVGYPQAKFAPHGRLLSIYSHLIFI